MHIYGRMNYRRTVCKVGVGLHESPLEELPKGEVQQLSAHSIPHLLRLRAKLVNGNAADKLCCDEPTRAIFGKDLRNVYSLDISVHGSSISRHGQAGGQGRATGWQSLLALPIIH